MRSLFLLLTLSITCYTSAQYGSFSAADVKKARANTTVVVLDDGDTPYDRAMMNAIKADWKFSGEYEFVNVSDLAAQPIVPEKNYLLKTSKTDPAKFQGTFLTLVKGWKQKKGEALQQTDDAFTNIPTEHELAFILIDPKELNARNLAGMVHLYTKHLQDYLSQVENGKITDKTTADRLYASRNRLVRETTLWMGQEHLDQTMSTPEKIKEVYSSPVEVKPVTALMEAIEKQDATVTVSDVVLTVGDHRNKHCFKRVFNAGTGELMYQKDQQAIFGKNEGFLPDDMKSIERAR